MTRQVFFAAALAAGLALVPVLYVQFIWPSVLGYVPMHYTSAGVAGHFVERTWLRDISWLPGLAWVALTFLPQVQDGQKPVLEQLAPAPHPAVVVGSLALAIAAIVYRSAHASRAAPGLGPVPELAPAR
ncbi:hypothetical protein [Hymenobacter cheonanensis]|uniref:hypothetical protein n=1 Tax=Hymenobacter sp. CA2-7 TaxID=3063993 RepID=UPI0027138C8E|nr:hypothetical protein [Hymenobacter sp. CA2-7]MDO7886524.1 hypothetical protein [Hymenobacter sp. CA2-7]